MTGFNWKLILNSTTLTFNKILDTFKVFAKYSTKEVYKGNFKLRLSLKSCLNILPYSNDHHS